MSSGPSQPPSPATAGAFQWGLAGLSRRGAPAEIASVILFLASPLASFVTGATWRVDGGFMSA
jgi:NAD(P)-dependent dehydrogenase (short-subunit alcohol dehydrogenase family)